jgi:uncharacterized repeat protein (TIGR02543 family)
MNQAKCTTCGAGLTIRKGDKTCVCEYCQSTNIVENALALGKVEVDVTEDIKKLRANLTTFVQQNSIDEILRVSQKLLDWIPQDFVALYFFGYAKQQQNQPRFLYDFYKEPPVFTDVEFEVVVDHIIHKSELRDKRRILHWFESFGNDLVQQYLNIHKEREDQENNYANVPRDVFVCYSSYNVEIAEQVVKELEADGNTCWISTRNLRPNDTENYWKNIENAIQKSSIVLVISSEDSMRSKDVHLEIELSRRYEKKMVEFKIDDSPHNTLFKHMFNGIKWVDGEMDVKQSYLGLLQRVYEEQYQIQRPGLGDSIEPIVSIETDSSGNGHVEFENYLDEQNYELTDLNLILSEIETKNTIAIDTKLFNPKEQVLKSKIRPKIFLGVSILTLFLMILTYTLSRTDNSTIYFVTNSASSQISPIIIDNREINLISEVVPIREGYTFVGWFEDEQLFNAFNYSDISETEVTLYAKWEVKDYKIDLEQAYLGIIDEIGLNPSEKISSISLGGHSTSVLTTEGRVVFWGKPLSLRRITGGDYLSKVDLTPYFNLDDDELIQNLYFNDRYTLVITSTGRILAIELERWTYKLIDLTSFFNLKTGDRIISLTNNGVGDSDGEYGGSHGALSSDGRVFMWGNNESGQLGTGTLQNSDFPIEITKNFTLNMDETIISLSNGSSSASALTSQGRLFTWGDNRTGTLGDSTYTDKLFPNEITNLFELNENEVIESVDIGWHSHALTSFGRMFTWGNNLNGQLGNNQIYSGRMSSFITPTDITAGFELDEGETITSAYSGGDSTKFAITSNNRIFFMGLLDGITSHVLPTDVTSELITNRSESFARILMGKSHVAAITNNMDTVYLWGSNSSGQIDSSEVYPQSQKWVPPTKILGTEVLSSHISSLTVSFDEPIGLLTETIKDGFVFDAWYTDESYTELFVLETMPARNLKVFGRWFISE